VTAPERSELLVRAASLYVPILLAVVLALQLRPRRRRVAGAVLATAWNISALLVVNVVAVSAGWWSFGVSTSTVAGVPADLWVGWALLWGAVPLLATSGRLWLLAIVFVLADLLLMPLAEPVVVLHPTWLIGESLAVAICLIPGLLLGRWTAEQAQLRARATLQFVAFTGLLFFVLPSLVFAVAGGAWAPLLDRPRWHFVLAGLALAPVGAVAIQAVREFVAHGGTPVPLDPPTSLVTTGPYAYLANPMQVASSVLLAAWGFLLVSSAIVAGAVMAAAFSAGLAAWTEDGELRQRFGAEWEEYRDGVRLWLPRWRPVVSRPAVVHVARTCEPCSQVGQFLQGRPSIGLEIRDAERCASTIQRITYVGEADISTGVSAVGRSLEHVNLAWAAASWVARLPLVEPLLQLVTDAVGGEPRSISQPAADAINEPEGT
jgi:protein-S-isoprenylcysteine O-methyltransferase Ste14